MRKILFISIVIMCLIAENQAQAQRRLPLQKGIQITGGTVNGFNVKNDGNGFHFGMGLTSYTTSGNYWKFGGEYLQKRHLYEEQNLPQAQFTLEGGYFLNFFSDGSKTLFSSLGLSGLAGYETINWDEKLLPDGATIENEDAFIYGSALTLETEVFLTNRLILLLDVKERMRFGSSVGEFNTQLGVGVRFMLD